MILAPLTPGCKFASAPCGHKSALNYRDRGVEHDQNIAAQ
jgi:hypothetical protein